MKRTLIKIILTFLLFNYAYSYAENVVFYEPILDVKTILKLAEKHLIEKELNSNNLILSSISFNYLTNQWNITYDGKKGGFGNYYLINISNEEKPKISGMGGI